MPEHATMFSGEGERWIGTLLGADAVIDMPEIGGALKLADAYEGAGFPATGDGQGPEASARPSRQA